LRMPRQQPGRENENEMNIIKNKIWINESY
jgi:hypothetical protein